MPRREVLQELNLWPVWRLRVASPLPSDVAGEVTLSPDMPVNRRESILSMEWDELRQAVSGCTDCRLHETRSQAVFGIGDEQADWMLVGEGPGAEEDKQGEPFVGQAGKLLD
ncbi:MAG: uracil-DNA glycosylase family protein, partial [Sulfurimicrobium sp.]|nr:uracil-DNA glycosylase family protein [Sulfurimicrobium sp.]